MRSSTEALSGPSWNWAQHQHYEQSAELTSFDVDQSSWNLEPQPLWIINANSESQETNSWTQTYSATQETYLGTQETIFDEALDQNEFEEVCFGMVSNSIQ